MVAKTLKRTKRSDTMSDRLTRIETIVESVDEKLDVHLKDFREHTDTDRENFEKINVSLNCISQSLATHLMATEHLAAQVAVNERRGEEMRASVHTLEKKSIKWIAYISGALAVLVLVWQLLQSKLAALLGL